MVVRGGAKQWLLKALVTSLSQLCPSIFPAVLARCNKAAVALLHGDWVHWPQRETECLQEGGSLECDFILSSCKSCVYFGSGGHFKQHDHAVTEVLTIQSRLSLETLAEKSTLNSQNSYIVEYPRLVTVASGPVDS